MWFKKSGRQIFGVELTAAEQKAVDREIEKRLAEYTDNHNLEIIAMTLLTLHEEFGFGEGRLRRFFDRYDETVEGLIQRYELDEDDGAWIATQKLKEMGIDVAKWHAEAAESRK